jgi:tRNA nucleotidyltransferase (CCA-adding enzyme)
MHPVLVTLAQAYKKIGGMALLVGGAVRDFVMGTEPNDLDIEVYGLGEYEIKRVLIAHGFRAEAVGDSFGVIQAKRDDLEIDVSPPRRENKVGRGHKGFIVTCDPSMTPKEAAARRDFTINSMAQNILTGEIIDPWDGRGDLEQGILRGTSEHFSEDPLRVLRGVRFAGRFGFSFDPRTALECRSIVGEASSLATDRIWGEWRKLLDTGKFWGHAMSALMDSGWWVLYPELQAMYGTRQDPKWHPEGDVWEHTKKVTGAMAFVASERPDKVQLVLAALCHDMGKPCCTGSDFTAPGHAQKGAEIAEQFLERIHAPAQVNGLPVKEIVLPLVQEHMLQEEVAASDKAVRRLAVRLGKASVEQLSLVIMADRLGRKAKPSDRTFPGELCAVAERLAVAQEAPKPLVMGRDLIPLGWKQGKEMGDFLREAFEAQLDGQFSTKEAGIEWLVGERAMRSLDKALKELLGK